MVRAGRRVTNLVERSTGAYGFRGRSTPHALEALQTAKEIAGYEGLKIVETRHVLWSILSREDAAACRLLRRLGAPVEAIREACGVQRYGPTGTRAEDFEDAMTLVGIESRSAAEALGDECVGTAHLLLGLFTSEAATRLLGRFGVTRGLVGAEILDRMQDPDPDPEDAGEELPGARPTPTALCPTAVTTAGLWTTFQIVIGVLELVNPWSWNPLLLMEAVLRNGITLALIGPLVRRKQYAWSALTALFFAQCAFWCSVSVYLFVSALRPSAGFHAFELLILSAVPFGLLLLFDWALIALTRALFQAGWWFGVGERQTWTTMKRGGGWVLLVMTPLYAYALVKLAAAGQWIYR